MTINFGCTSLIKVHVGILIKLTRGSTQVPFIMLTLHKMAFSKAQKDLKLVFTWFKKHAFNQCSLEIVCC